MYLAIRVHHLQAAFHGSGDCGSEWPPSPWRLFCALISGAMRHREQFGFERARTAFQWLERLPAPTILTPKAASGPTVLLQGPPNDLDAWVRKKGKGVNLLGQKQISPTFILNDQPIWYLWELPSDVVPAHFPTVADAAARLYSLGLGIDPAYAAVHLLPDDAVVGLSAAEGVERWNPHSGGPQGTRYRVPQRGSFDSSEEVHQEKLREMSRDGRRNRAKFAKRPRFGRIVYRKENDTRSHWVLMSLQDRDGKEVVVAQHDVCTISAMVRHEVMELAKLEGVDPEKISTYFRGAVEYGSHHRLSYIPLPSVGRTFSDGMVRRILLAEPVGARDPDFERIVYRLGIRRGNEPLRSERGRMSFFLGPCSAKKAWHYTRKAQVWESVTPVILSDCGTTTRDKMRAFRRALHHAGYSGVVENFELRRSPWSRTSYDTHAYSTPEYLRRGDRSRFFAKIWMTGEVSGPVAVGDGRFVGIGVFRAVG